MKNYFVHFLYSNLIDVSIVLDKHFQEIKFNLKLYKIKLNSQKTSKQWQNKVLYQFQFFFLFDYHFFLFLKLSTFYGLNAALCGKKCRTMKK